ncbi:MAG: hypothetical protein WBA42_19840 [Mesorhizobium sp.]
MQPPRRGEIELPRIAANFEHDRRRLPQPGRLLGDPQRVGQLFRLAKQQGFGLDPEHCLQPCGIGKAGLAEDFRRADPQDGSRRFGRPAQPRKQQAGKRQHETADGTRIAGAGAMDLGQRSPGQATAKGRIEAAGPGEHSAIALGNAAVPDHAGGRVKALGQRPFNPRDLAAQGENGFPRHGTSGHDGSASSKIVPVMFLWIPEAGPRVKHAVKRIYSSFAFRPPIKPPSFADSGAKAYMRPTPYAPDKENAWHTFTNSVPGTTSFRPRWRKSRSSPWIPMRTCPRNSAS